LSARFQERHPLIMVEASAFDGLFDHFICDLIHRIAGRDLALYMEPIGKVGRSDHNPRNSSRTVLSDKEKKIALIQSENRRLVEALDFFVLHGSVAAVSEATKSPQCHQSYARYNTYVRKQFVGCGFFNKKRYTNHNRWQIDCDFPCCFMAFKKIANLRDLL